MNRIIWSSVAIVLGLSMVGCAQPAPPSPPAGTSDEPKAGGVLRDRNQYDPFDFDTSYDGKSQPNPQFTGRVYDDLIRYKREPGTGYTELIPVPGLAERWEVSSDGRTYTFHLRKGVKWQNLPPLNGRELTSADIRFVLEYYSRTGEFKDKNLAKGSFAYMLDGLEPVQTPDKYTVVASFKQPYAPFLNYLASRALPVAPREFYDRDGHLKDGLVGTGPFILDESASQKGTRWVFKKNPDYWDTGKPYLDQIQHLVLPHDTTAVAAFQTKQIDLLDRIEEVVAKDLEKVKDAVVYKAPNPGSNNGYLTMHKPPFNDIRVRKAFSLAIDREEFVRTFTNGEGEIAMAGVWPGYFSLEERRKILRYDPQEARRLLAEAGHPNGVTFTQLLRSPEEANDNSGKAALLQQQLKKAGFDMKIEVNPDKASGSKRLHDGQFDLIGFITKPTYGDVDAYIYGAFHSKSKQNYEQINDPKLDSLVDAQRQVTDPVKRREAIRDAARYINESGLGIGIFYPIHVEAWHSQVKGYIPLAFGSDGPAFAQVWLDK